MVRFLCLALFVATLTLPRQFCAHANVDVMAGSSWSQIRRRNVPEFDPVDETLLADFPASLQVIDDRPLFDGAFVKAGIVRLPGGVVAVVVRLRRPDPSVAVIRVALERPLGILVFSRSGIQSLILFKSFISL